MILWVCFTLGNIFGFRAESRSEGARDPLLFSPGAHALTPDQQDGVWGGDCCCCRRTCFFKLYADKLEKRRFTQNVQPKKKLRTTLALPLKSLWAQKKEPAGMGELDKQMQEIVALLNSATPEQRNAVETLLRSRAKPE